jgi:hypothetical protein
MHDIFKIKEATKKSKPADTKDSHFKLVTVVNIAYLDAAS